MRGIDGPTPSGSGRSVTAFPPADARPVAKRQSTFASLEHRKYRVLFLSGISMILASHVQMIARGWLARDLTGSNTGLGGVYLAFGILMLISTPFGGVISDRFPKRTVVIVAQVLLTASAGGILLSLLLDVTEYWMLIGASCVQAVGFSTYSPARVAFTADLVPIAMLPNAMALTQMSNSVAQIVGPAVAGVLIGTDAIGVEGVYFLTTGLGVIGILASSRLPLAPPAADRPKRSVLKEIGDGVRYVRGSRQLINIVTLSLLVIMIGFPYMALLPGVAEDLFDQGASGYAMLTIAGAVGATIVSLLVARRGGSHGWRIQSIAGITLGVGLLMLAAAPSFIAALVAGAVLGAGAAAFQSMSNSLALTHSSLEFHGRVQSLLFLSFSGFALIALPLSVLADSIGLRPTLAAMGLCLLAVMAVHLALRRRAGRGVRSFTPM